MYWKLQEDPDWKPLKCSTMIRMIRIDAEHFQCVQCENIVDLDMLPAKVTR